MPARAAIAPGARPGGLAGLSRFPQRKVHRILLAVVHVHTRASHHILNITTGQLAIMLKFFYAIENVAVHYISIAIINQALYGANDILDMLGYARINMRTAYIQLIHYFKIGIDVTVADVEPLHALFVGSVDDFVIHIGEVLHMGYIIALVLQEAANYVPGYEGARIADMGMVVGGNAAHINIGLTGSHGNEFFFSII